MAAGTATLRDAADGEDFIRRVRERTGVELEIVSGETEAWLSYLAVMRGLRLDPSKRLLIIDIGGGSTEFIRAGGHATEFINTEAAKLEMASLQIGSVRLTERILHHDPPTAREAADLRLAIDAELTGLGWKLETDLLVGIAGTVTTVCAVALEMETYDPDRVHGYRLSRKEVERVLGLFGSMPLAERRKTQGSRPRARRRDLRRYCNPRARDVRGRGGQRHGERPGCAMGPGVARARRHTAAAKAVLSGRTLRLVAD